jgi:glycerophosphoryl diester phosphodiesterase
MSRNRGFFAGRRPRVIGHRGTAGTAPENTMISFELAAAIGVRGLLQAAQAVR